MQRTAVIDYGMGNLRSVAKAVESVSNDDVVITSDAQVIAGSDRIVCPGQGAARDCMAALDRAGLSKVITDTAGDIPFLGICMGLQVLLTHSDENSGVDCLNMLPGQVRRFGSDLNDEVGNRLKIPHMGWSTVEQKTSHALWQGIENHSRFYFAHSYYVVPDASMQVTATCKYGISFAVALATRNIFACQFHPEKSADAGLRLLKNFTQWNGE